VISLLVALNVMIVIALVWVATRRDVSPVFAIGLFCVYGIWYGVPIAVTLLAWDHIARRAFAPLDKLVYVAVLDCIAFLLTVVLFAVGWRRWKWIVNGSLGKVTFSPRMMTWLILASVGLWLVLRKLTLGLVGTSYTESNAFMARAEGTTAMGSLGIFFVISSILQAFLFACIIMPRHRWSRVISLILWAWLLVSTASEVLVGSRVALITPCILLLMWVHERRISRAALLMAYASIGFFVATVGVLLTIVIAQVRAESKISISNTGQESKQLVGQRSDPTDQMWLFVDHVTLKFETFTCGSVLLERRGVGVAGVKPYIGALLSLVPRRIMPGKPLPGSVDGTNRGLPQRIVAIDFGYDEDSGNVQVSPASVAMWQFGFLGLIPLVLINTLNLRLLNSLLNTRSLLTRALALLIFTIPTSVGVFSTADFIIMSAERAVAIYVGGTVLLHIVLMVFRPVRAPRPMEQPSS
jgi:hypothetical protein